MKETSQSVVGRRKAGDPERKRETFSIDPKTKAMLLAYSDRTRIPMSQVVDLAVAEYLKDQPEAKEK